MAHLQDFGNGLHRQIAPVGGTDRLVALLAQLLGSLVKLSLTAGEATSEAFQGCAGLGGLSLWAGDPMIVRAIPASRLA